MENEVIGRFIERFGKLEYQVVIPKCKGCGHRVKHKTEQACLNRQAERRALEAYRAARA